jgi:hypothetical protein
MHTEDGVMWTFKYNFLGSLPSLERLILFPKACQVSFESSTGVTLTWLELSVFILEHDKATEDTLTVLLARHKGTLSRICFDNALLTNGS